jgi:hypothetical protein
VEWGKNRRQKSEAYNILGKISIKSELDEIIFCRNFKAKKSCLAHRERYS